MLTELSEEFKKSIINSYKKDLTWVKTLNILENNVNKNTAMVLFSILTDSLTIIFINIINLLFLLNVLRKYSILHIYKLHI